MLDVLSQLTVMLPAYNEAGVIKQVVSDLVSFLERNVEQWEIVIVDDGSRIY